MSVVFGVDILKGSVRGKIKPRYAVVVLDNGREFEKIVSRNKLFRMIREKRPEIVAVDNVYEVFKSKEDLIIFLRNTPPNVRLVQVSGKFGSLPKLARRFGLRMNIRNPIDEAKACAYLASFGVGYEVSVFTDKTKITVTRNRSLGKGGWRQKKYGRRIHNEVRRIYREIRYKLSTLGFDFVEETRKGFGGISKGILLVNAAKKDIPLNSFKTKDVQVKVEAIEKEKVELIPISRTQRYTIVGVDPGATTAVAVIDLSGNLIDVSSKKSWKISDVIGFISSLGKPVVVATDKSTPPEFVQKIRALFNAVLYLPKDDISVEKKKTLTAGYKLLNDHERDALAAALDAFNNYKSKFRNIEKRVPIGIDSDRIKAEVLSGTPLRLSIIEEKEDRVDKKQQILEITKEDIERRDRIIRELKEENEILKRQISELKSEIERLKNKIVSIASEEHERIRRDNYVKNLEKEIFQLNKLLRSKEEELAKLKKEILLLRRMRYLELKGWKAVKLLKKFSKEELERVEKEIGINPGDIVYIVDSSGGSKSLADSLCKKGIRAVIYRSEMSHLAAEIFDEYGVPRINVDEIEILAGEDFAVINLDKFNRIYREKLNDMRKSKVELVEKIVEEYRKTRMI
ncbi:hypothetical protein B6U96_14920 [Archaeoglobales archaeon ex4484_92]|nr:MAG: hypothetical protein B6U96_14920 [Archaeoglobales archaeon ex4484_92]